MDEVRLRQERLRSHRLTAPAASPSAAARHMLAVQSQEFWGGRWALAIRSRGEPGISVVDRAFDDGRLVRSWTQRGTLHVVPAEDLGWMLALTADRQFRSAAGRHRALGLDEAAFGTAERAVRVALAGGDRLTRDQVRDVIEAAGVDTAGQRSVHLLQALSLRGVVCHGPVVHRDGGIAREQYVVLCEEWITDPVSPPEPAAEAFVRFIDGHGPAGVADFCWWSGLTLTAGREAAAAAAGRVRAVGDDLFVALRPPRRVAGGPDVLALPAFDEYYLSYADRGPVCGPGHQRAVGPGANGLVSPTLLSAGVVVGRWTHSRALGRRDAGRAEVFEDQAPSAEAVTAALDRYTAFVTG